MDTIRKITIDNVTEIRTDKNNRTYRLIYTPESWSVDSETGEITTTKSESHFCYDESVFDMLKPGVVINVKAS